MERDPRLYYGQRCLSDIGDHGQGVSLVPFHAAKRGMARTLTVSAAAVPASVVRDFGQQRIDEYRISTRKTQKKLRGLSRNPDVEAYVIVAVNPHTKKWAHTRYAIGVATIGLAEIVPASGIQTVRLKEVLGEDLTGVVGTFWYGSPEVTHIDNETDERIGELVSGLLVPRMVEIAEGAGTFACTFVASGQPDQTNAMRKDMTKIATGKWLEPVSNPSVPYDMLVPTWSNKIS